MFLISVIQICLSCDRNTLFGVSLTSKERQMLPVWNDFSNNGLSLPTLGIHRQTLPSSQQYYSIDFAHLTFVLHIFSNPLVHFAPEMIFSIVPLLFLRYCEWEPCGFFVVTLSCVS